MDLDRGLLAKIDRRLLADLDHEQVSRMVRVPVSEAMWATWRRYCAAIGLPMGRAIAELITRELHRVASSDERSAVFRDQLEARVLARSEELDDRERRLKGREQSVRRAEQRLRVRTIPLGSTPGMKVGRNEPCPCGSGVKYKRCHGL
jgi:preprotein translocase subunit SecA